MTSSCVIALGLCLCLYVTSTGILQASYLLKRPRLEGWGRRALAMGVAINAGGLLLHLAFSHQHPFANMLSVISVLVIAFLAAGLLAEQWTSTRHLSLVLAPMASLGLLYPILMPIRFEDAESILVQYPWLGVHVLVALLGHVGFALAFCAAVCYLIQSRCLKRGRLNRYLPPLDMAGTATLYAAGIGFSSFTLGLAMGVVWLFGAPGELLGKGDLKIWMAVPPWLLFAAYLYLRGLRGRQGSRLKWLVVVGFLLGIANLLGVRHQFEEPPALPASPPATHAPSAP